MKSKTGVIAAPGLSGQDAGVAVAGMSPARKQKGAAALLITMILVVIAGLSALVVSKTAFNEQRLSGTDIRSKEVYNAAFGALDYAAGRLQNHFSPVGPLPDIVWSNLDADGKGLRGATTSPLAFVNAAGGATFNAGADSYTPTVTYTLLTDESADPLVIGVAATANAASDTHVTKTLSARFMVTNIITSMLGGAPPLVVEGCIDGITGTPDIDTRDDGATAIVTLDGIPDDTCIDKGHFDFPAGSDAESDNTSLNLFEKFFPGLGGDRSIIKSWSDREEAAGIALADRTVIYVEDEELNTWNDNVGSGTVDPATGDPTPTSPVILFFEADDPTRGGGDGDGQGGCTPINGNVTIWGLVFYDEPSCDVTVGAQGGGKATIYGTMAFSGDLEQFNANTEIIFTDLSDTPDDEFLTRMVDIMPGTIKDW